MEMTKSSSREEIKNYFDSILALKQQNEEYPVNLDDVWPLVYIERGKAVRALKEYFVVNEDFIIFAQNGKKSKGRPKDGYRLSVPCLEYFIAKKVRSVFEVYRQVFHKVIETKPKNHLEILVESAQALLDQSRRIDSIDIRLSVVERDKEENTEKLLTTNVSGNILPVISKRDEIRQLVNVYSAATSIPQRHVWHKVYEQLYYLYHVNVKAYKKDNKETYLDVAERNHCLDRLYDIVSNLVREQKQKNKNNTP